MEGTFQTRASCVYYHSRTLKHTVAGQESSTAARSQRVLPAPAGPMPEQDYGCLSSQLLPWSYSLVTARAPTVGFQPTALHGWQLLLRHTTAVCESSFSSPYAREIRLHKRQMLRWYQYSPDHPAASMRPATRSQPCPALHSNSIADLQPPLIVTP